MLDFVMTESACMLNAQQQRISSACNYLANSDCHWLTWPALLMWQNCHEHNSYFLFGKLKYYKLKASPMETELK